MDWPDFLLFASDATLVGVWGIALLALAALSLVAEYRRSRRRHVEAVGCMPWTALFIIAAVTGAGLLTMALRGWMAG